MATKAKPMSIGEQLNDNMKRITSYKKKVEGAYKFAGDKTAEGWADQFQIGLVLAGLELIPYSSDIRPSAYWQTAPEPPHGGNDWPISWIVEYGVLNKVGDSYGDE